MLKKKLDRNLRFSENEVYYNGAPPNICPHFYKPPGVPEDLLTLDKQTIKKMDVLKFDKKKVQYVYNPVDYAYAGYSRYVRKYLKSSKKILFVGLNPGPYGMCQTGIPFGDVSTVKEWMELEMDISKPLDECPKKPVDGLKCTTVEQSGKRFWGFFKKKCGAADNFFRNAFVINYCPIAFFDRSGKNVTPNELEVSSREELEKICDEYLEKVVEMVKCEIIICVGRYAEHKVKSIFIDNSEINILYMKHPSPQVGSEDNWLADAHEFLIDNHLSQHFSE